MTIEKKIYPDNFGVSHEQMQILEKAENMKYKGDQKGSIDLLNQILYKDPSCVPALEEIADCYLTLGQDDKSLKTVDFIHTLTDTSYTAAYLSGFILGKQGKFKESVVFLEKANKLNQNNPEVLRCYGWSLFMFGKVGKGISLIERAKNLLPNDPQILNDLAVCKIETGETEIGIEILSEIQEIDPGNQRALHTIKFLKENMKKGKIEK